MKIEFSPPDISQVEIDNVVDVLKSGWITTGPKTKQFEKEIAKFCGTNRSVCLSSATVAMELTLRMLGVGPGDEVITSTYTYTASCSVICHVGAKPVLIDLKKDSIEMDYNKLEEAITDKTKVIIPVDIAGILCDYDKIFEIVERKKHLFNASNEMQSKFKRIVVMADGSHSFGAIRNGKISGGIADFTVFSFHAVKNLTTAEGGSVTWTNKNNLDNDDLYKKYQILSLHGQTKDALSKTKLGSWEYDIVEPAYKCNMTDIQAAIGLAQLNRYKEMLERRQEIIQKYNNKLQCLNIKFLNHRDENHTSSGHLYLTRIIGITLEQRNEIIIKMAGKGIATNVHYKPLPMLTAYKNIGFDIKDYPNSYDFYHNEITLPLYSKLTDEEVEYIIDSYIDVIKEEIINNV